MKQVVFAVFLMAMASLTGCLNEEDSPVDDKTDDSTSDNNDGLIDPVGQTGYTPPDEANITVDAYRDNWVAKNGNRITTSCNIIQGSTEYHVHVFDSENNLIHVANSWNDYGVSQCDDGYIKLDVTLGPEPTRVGLFYYDDGSGYAYYTWLVTF